MFLYPSSIDTPLRTVLGFFCSVELPDKHYSTAIKRNDRQLKAEDKTTNTSHAANICPKVT